MARISGDHRKLAHWLLHRDCSIAVIKQKDEFPGDGEEVEDADKSAVGWTSLQFIEWQASKLGAALLIPKIAAIHSIYSIQIGLSVPLRQGVIYENKEPEGRAESDRHLGLVAQEFGVSKTVARIRLTDLSLYHQQQQRPYRTGRAENPFLSIGRDFGSPPEREPMD